MVRLALVHLAVGSVLGGLLLGARATGAWPALWAWRAAHVDAMLVGGMLQLALGVARWMLPRTGLGASSVPEGIAAGLLNAGVLAAALGHAAGSAAAVLGGRVGVAVAVTVLVARLVARVRPARRSG